MFLSPSWKRIQTSSRRRHIIEKMNEYQTLRSHTFSVFPPPHLTFPLCLCLLLRAAQIQHLTGLYCHCFPIIRDLIKLVQTGRTSMAARWILNPKLCSHNATAKADFELNSIKYIYLYLFQCLSFFPHLSGFLSICLYPLQCRPIYSFIIFVFHFPILRLYGFLSFYLSRFILMQRCICLTLPTLPILTF